MAFASSVVMFAVTPQNLLSLASTEDSFLLLVDVLSVYGRHICSEIAKKTAATLQSALRCQGPVARRILNVAVMPSGIQQKGRPKLPKALAATTRM
jgi:hypothetical protein